MLKKITPIMLVDQIERSLPFWRSLDYEVTVQVPHESRIGFVILVHGDSELMLQTFSSALADVPEAVSSRQPGSTILYIEVEDVDEVERRLDGAEVVIPRRTTDYGATEIFVREPSGHIVGFAEHPD